LNRKSVVQMKKYRTSNYLWLLGFMSFFAFAYIQSHQLADLMYLNYLGFFGFYFTEKLKRELPDERLLENQMKAKAQLFPIVCLCLFMICLAIIFQAPMIWIAILASVGWNCSLIGYAYLFYYFDQH